MNISPRHKDQSVSQSQAGFLSPLTSLQNDINLLFEDFFNHRQPRPFGESKQAFVPVIDLIQNDKNYQVKAELPGLKEDEIDLFIEDGYMVLKGERMEKKEQKKEHYIVQESNYGSFYRSFPLPKDVNFKKQAKASLTDGVLIIELARIEGEKPQKAKINIKGK